MESRKDRNPYPFHAEASAAPVVRVTSYKRVKRPSFFRRLCRALAIG